MGNRRGVILRIFFIGFLGLLLASGCLAQPNPSLPMQDRMRKWKLAHRHPDPLYLNNLQSFPELDDKVRYFGSFDVFGDQDGGSLPSWIKPKVTQYFSWKGAGTWRPDASAQVDELRARLYDKAKEDGWK